MTEAYVGNEELMEYYGTISNGVGSIAHLPINFCLVSGDSKTNAMKVIHMHTDKVFSNVTPKLLSILLGLSWAIDFGHSLTSQTN